VSTTTAANGHATRLPDIGPDVADDAAWSAAARASLAHTDARLDKRFDQDDGMDRILALRARAVDHLLRDAWLRCIPAEAPMALFAVGGYGRGELFPHSDVDVLVLAAPEVQQAHHDAVARLFALLWDAGLPISHSVRSAGECTAAAAADQSVTTALIEERLIVGEPVDEGLLIDAIGPTRVWPPRDFFVAKREELRLRHARFGDTSDNLEPNIKEGPGGLRDLHTLTWKRWSVSATWGPMRPPHWRASAVRWGGCAMACTAWRTGPRSVCASTTRRRWRSGWVSPTTPRASASRR
jgi:[protein-PII] uridylyltransferase